MTQLWDEANKLHIEGKHEEAEKLYDQLLTQNPTHPGLLATFGTLKLHTHEYGQATAFLLNAVERMRAKGATVPSDVLSNLGLAYKYSGLADKAMATMREAVQRDDCSPESMTVYAAMFTETGAEGAEKTIRWNEKALKANPNLALAHWNMSIALLEQGDFERGWDEYEWGFEAKTRLDRALGGCPVWDGKAPGTVVIYGEQGIGDEIMFSSMIPDVTKTNPVIFECHKRLKTLFEKSFGIRCIGTREDPEVYWPAEWPFDYQISVASLGKLYRRRKEDFPGMPYLTAEAAPRADTRRPRIGISWTGGQKANRVQKRTVPLSWWKDIFTQDAEFISLQYTDCAEEIRLVEENFGVNILQFPEIKAEDYYETAKLVMSCDLVISVCTSVIHLAGALGVPCWVLTPAHPAWRYGNKGPMPWYKSVRLYRQPENDMNAWIPVIQRVAKDLEGFLSENTQDEERIAYG